MLDPILEDSKRPFPLISGSTIISAIIICPSIFIPLNFTLYYLFNSDDYYEVSGVRQIPTISLTGADYPASVFFAYGLHLESLLFGIFFLMLYRKIQRLVDSQVQDNTHSVKSESCLYLLDTLLCRRLNLFCEYNRNNVLKWNRYCVVTGLVASFSMSVVGSIGLNVNETAHSFFAFVMFMGGIFHMILGYLKIYRFLLPNSKRRVIQLAIILAIPMNIIILFIAAMIYGLCTDYYCRAVSVDLLPVVEFTTMTALLIYVCGFYADLKDCSLVLEALC